MLKLLIMEHAWVHELEICSGRFTLRGCRTGRCCGGRSENNFAQRAGRGVADNQRGKTLGKRH
jgi:hypothetical protein